MKKWNIILRELSAQLFVVLLVTLCISILNVNKSYAVSFDEFYTIMEINVQDTNDNIKNWWNGIKSQEDTMIGLETYWKTNNSIAIYGEYNNTYGWKGSIYFIHNSGSVYRNSYGIKWTEGRNGWDSLGFTKSWVNNGSNNHNIDNFVPSYADILAYGNIFNDNNTSWVFITDSDIYTNNTITDKTEETWYFKTYRLSRGAEFTKSVHNVVFYENRTTILGTITEPYELSKMRFYLYDVTDTENLYPPLIASLGNGIDVFGTIVEIQSRLIQVGHQYDLYYMYEGQYTEQYRYVWRNFMNVSGDIIGGYTAQNAVNDIINSQTNDNQELKNSIESGNKEIISAIESGNKEIVGSINEILDPTISGDIISNINIIPEISFSGDTFFTMIFNNIYSLFTSGDEVVTLHIPITRTDQAGEITEFYDVPSNFLRVNNTSILRIGLSLTWWWVIGYPFIKWLYSLVFKLNQGSIGEAVDELTTTKGLF